MVPISMLLNLCYILYSCILFRILQLIVGVVYRDVRYVMKSEEEEEQEDYIQYKQDGIGNGEGVP